MLLLSFTRNVEDVRNLSETNNFEGGIIAKIENSKVCKTSKRF